MADFVAVIRRTVDGLSDNSPEMRARVYEKARGAVRRQLENMKPRPSDDMIDRQMGKLETAITEVEGTHTPAFAPEPFSEPPIEQALAEPVEQEPVREEPAALAPEEGAEEAAYEERLSAEPAYEEPAPEQPASEQPAYAEHAYEEPAPAPHVSDVPVSQQVVSEPELLEHTSQQGSAPAEVRFEQPQVPYDVSSVEVGPPVVEPAPAPVAPLPSVPVTVDPADRDAADALAAEYADMQGSSRAPVPPVVPAETGFDDNDTVAVEEPWVAEDRSRESDTAWTEVSPVEPEPVQPAAGEAVPEPVHHETFQPEVDHREPAYRQPEPEAPSLPAASWDLPEWTDPAPAQDVASFEHPAATGMPVAGHIEPVWSESVEERLARAEEAGFEDLGGQHAAPMVPPAAVVLPPVSGGLTSEGEPSHSWALDETDPFQADARRDGMEPSVSDWSWPVDRTADAERSETEDLPPPPANWDEIDSLMAAGGATTAAQSRSMPLPEPVPAPRRPTSYRAEPKKSVFSIKRIVTTLVLLLVFGGGGYAYWTNRDDVDSWVSGMIASLNTAPPQTTNGGTTASGTGGAASGTPANGVATTDLASARSSSKFTQRLQTDGTEIDDGAAPPPAGSTAEAEGKSVAAQTEASRPVDTADASATTPTPSATDGTSAAPPIADGTPATVPAAGATPPVNPPVNPTAAPNEATTQLPAGAQKMFLYEERLGQTAPTAIEGGVAWSLKEEAAEAGQRPEPVIQAQITVPDRGLTALMTIKRNTDSSLPASHTIEFVFSLPENFEGGSIDSVQRVAMKRNEQDRGDPLIAVPAKITDDFHMIALNDFPEAVTTNLDLLRTRSWIDIPLTYRNGRRALLTLDKGEAGTDAFNKALAAWAQARPAGQ